MELLIMERMLMLFFRRVYLFLKNGLLVKVMMSKIFCGREVIMYIRMIINNMVVVWWCCWSCEVV